MRARAAVVGAAVFAAAALAGYVAAGAVARQRAAAPPGPVVVHRDPSLPGRWAVAFRDGVLVLVSAPELKYPHVGRGPTFRVWVLNLGDRPVRFGYENFRVLDGGRVRPVDDGEPPLASRLIPPLRLSHGAVTYYGPPVDGFVIEHGRQRAVVDLSPRRPYPVVPSVAGWLYRLWGRLPSPPRPGPRGSGPHGGG